MDIARPHRPRRRRLLLVALLAPALAVSLTLALRQLRAAPPTVARTTVWIDTVREGPLLLEVQGQGTLVSEEVRWITATTPGRVERIALRPGAAVGPDAVLLELSNPDLQLQALEAERQVTGAEAELVNLRATLENQRLAQESLIASLGSDTGDARRRATADQDLFDKGFLSDLEMRQSRDRAEERAVRLSFEQRRLQVLAQGTAAQAQAQRAQVERLRDIAAFRRRQVAALQVQAGVAGVLQELPLQVGQWVTPGTLMAKVARPDRLKAEIRVPETLAKDVQIGQEARIDTHNGVVAGKVARVDPAVQGGTVRVDVAMAGPLPQGARPDLSVDGTIELMRLPRVLYTGRPALGQAGATVGLFRLTGDTAVRVPVRLGRSSVRAIEIASGLRAGDQVILSDMSPWDGVDRIRLQ